MIEAAEIVESLGPLLLECQPGRAQRFRRPAIDSRTVGRGDLFVALRGAQRDGQEFVGVAVEGGARGVLVHELPERLAADVAAFVVPDTLVALQRLATARREHRRAKVIGVTGSVGKTSTKELIAAVLGTHYPVLKSEANYNTEIGLPLTLLELTHRHRRAALEMAMRAPGEIRTLCEIARPDVGVVTNVGVTHMETLGTIEAIADAKAELVESLGADGVAVLNADDPLVRPMAGRTRARVVLYGTSPDADVRATEIESRGLDGVSFRLYWQGESTPVHVSELGAHSVSNALAAAAVASADGMSLRETAAALEGARVPSRIRVLRGRGGCTILDDTYNASPASMEAALGLLKEVPARRHIAVLGDMKELGPVEREAHLEVGGRAAETADVIHTVGELGHLIREAAHAAGHRHAQHWPTTEAATEAVAGGLDSGDVVLVKASRAMAFERIVEALKE
ncbi:MAG: UDP-N-acetylmuramoyl-tripeptide--D-alanyl-D-alanine ligase [Dehalococcoidia bacterium]